MMIQKIIEFLTTLITSTGYLGVSISMFIESFFAPIPSEIILPFTGFVAANSTLNIYLVILVAGISSYLGSLPFYLIGYWGNDLVVNKFLMKYGKYFFISANDVAVGYKYFDKYGQVIVFLGRLIPIVRTVISFPAGVVKMNFIKFSLFTLLGSTIWSGILATAGYLLGENWEIVGNYVSKYENIILYGLVLLLVLFIGYKILKRKK